MLPSSTGISLWASVLVIITWAPGSSRSGSIVYDRSCLQNGMRICVRDLVLGNGGGNEGVIGEQEDEPTPPSE